MGSCGACTGSTVLTSTQPCAQDVRASLLRVNWLPPSGNWSIMETCPSSHPTICSSTPTLKVIRNILIEVIIAYVCKESKYSINSLLVRFLILFSAKLKNISLMCPRFCVTCHGSCVTWPVFYVFCPLPHRENTLMNFWGESRKWRGEEAWRLKIVQPAMHPGIRERNVGGISAAWKLGGLIFRRQQRSSVRKARRPSYLGGSLSRLITRLFNSR